PGLHAARLRSRRQVRACHERSAVIHYHALGVEHTSLFCLRCEPTGVVIDLRRLGLRPVVLEEAPPELRDNLMLGANIMLPTLDVEEQANPERLSLPLTLGQGSEDCPASEHCVARHQHVT